MRARILTLTLLCAACPSTETFIVGDGGPIVDAGTDAPGFDADLVFDAGPSDGAMGNECDPQPLCEGPCTRPWLLAANEDIFGEDPCAGRVLRYSLGPGGAVCGCVGYPADEHVRAVGYVPGPGGSEGMVFAAGDRRIEGYGSTRISIPLAGLLDSHTPKDIFPLENPEGVLGALVALTPNSGAASGIWISPTGSPTVYRFTEWGATFRSATESWTSTPHNRRGIRLSRLGYSSMDVDPWADMTTNLFHFRLTSPGTINAFYFGGQHRTVLAVDGLEAGNGHGVYAVATAVDEGEHTPPVTRCVEAMFEECSYNTAVGDPFSDDHVYTTCIRRTESESYLLRMRVSDQTCTVVREPVANTRIFRLALALDSYWE